MGASSHIVDFSQLYKSDLDLVGKKAYQLGELKQLGISIPDGFVITTSFFKEFLDQTGIAEEILEIQKINHPAIRDSVEKLFDPIRKSIMHVPIPQNLSAQLHKFYRKLTNLFNDTSLNIFTSSENNKSISYSNITGDANLLLKIKEIWASHVHKPVAIVVAKNIKSKSRGTITTNKPPKELKYFADKIQKHFYFPQVVDYVIVKDIIYITAILPFTGKVEELPNKTVQNRKIQKVLIKGISINPGIVTGPVKVFAEFHDQIQIKSGEIVVLPRLDMSTYRKIKRAKAIVVDTVLTSPYDRIIYRKDFKMPTIEGTKNATKILQNGNIITVNGVSGEIYKGGLI